MTNKGGLEDNPTSRPGQKLLQSELAQSRQQQQDQLNINLEQLFIKS
jgi:hypothetical protein